MAQYTQKQLKTILSEHKLWLQGEGGRRADLRKANIRYADIRGADLRYADLSSANLINADLHYADLSGADLRYADLSSANLHYANLREADLHGAHLSGANLRYVDLRYADLSSANLSGADLRYADLSSANLLCAGNMREIKTLQIEKWAIGYTADTLQIGCQRHPISKWCKWNTLAGQKWITTMDRDALDWAQRLLPLVLQIIDASPATPTGHEETT